MPARAYTKKAQVRMLETVSVIVIFFVMITLGFVFYSSIQRSSFEIEKLESADLRALRIGQKVASFPELQCSKAVKTGKCIDENMATNFAAQEDKVEKYFESFGFSEIKLQRVFPPSEGTEDEDVISLYSNELPSYSNFITLNIPVSVFYFDEGQEKMGVANLMVGVYG